MVTHIDMINSSTMKGVLCYFRYILTISVSDYTSKIEQKLILVESDTVEPIFS